MGVNCICVFAGSVFPAKCRCPAFTFYFAFICILCSLSKHTLESSQISLKPHPLGVPAEPSSLSNLAVYSDVQLEMQVNKFWALLLFGTGKDPWGKHTLEISQLPRNGGKQEQLQQAGGALGREASSFLGGIATSVHWPLMDCQGSSKGATRAGCALGARLPGAHPQPAEVHSPQPWGTSRMLPAGLPSVLWTSPLPGKSAFHDELCSQVMHGHTSECQKLASQGALGHSLCMYSALE